MRLARTLSMVLALAVMIPVVAVAQGDPLTPEGTPWTLTSRVVGSELTPVPLGVSASLSLEDGSASGSGGCNSFSGSYELDGASLRFSQELTRSLRACDVETEAVEDAYLSSLADVASWTVEGERLDLLDASGATVLQFEVPGTGLTTSQVAQLLERLATLEASVVRIEDRVDAIGISRLRDRIRALESADQQLQQQLAELRAPATPKPRKTSAFSAAEEVLLEGIPDRIADTCEPLRQRLPTGTVAAVECSPNTSRVREMAYYLMEDEPAVFLFGERMDAAGAEGIDLYGPPGQKTCADGNPSFIWADGGGIAAVGCYVEGGRANVRIIQDATACKQLDAGGTQLKRPVMYVAMTGASQDIAPLYEWTMQRKGRTQLSGVIDIIRRPDARKATGVGCP